MPLEPGRLVLNLEIVSAVRVAVGPTPWFVLESLAMRSSLAASGVELEVNARVLGAELRLSKDTVARALRVLAAAGLVSRVDSRCQHSGRFTASSYIVHLGAAGAMVEPCRTGTRSGAAHGAAPISASNETTAPASGPPDPSDAFDQLSLLG